MRHSADQPGAGRRGVFAGDVVFYVLMVGAVVLGWQIAIQPFIQRAPVEAAIRLAPTSPLALRRAAETELIAGRNDNAAALARDALGRAPFDVRALRVVGLTEAEEGRAGRADEILTLVGNWSLRDDPAHAWLVDHRLRQGNYASAFAHADTLVRRRQDIRPQVFRLFTLAGIEDPERSLPVIADLLSAEPPWRQIYLVGLKETPKELKLQMNLAILLQASPAPMSNTELQRLYRALLGKGQFEAVRTVRARLNRPPVMAVTNADFSDETAPEPFQWRLPQRAGVLAEIVTDDVRPGELALRVDYNGFATAVITEQLVFLSPGSYTFAAQAKVESGDPAARLAWTFTCASNSQTITSIPAGPASSSPNVWTPISGRFTVPGQCPAQWLRLETRAGDRRSPTQVWFDKISVSSSG